MNPSTCILAAIAFLSIIAWCAQSPNIVSQIRSFDGYQALNAKLEQLKNEYLIFRDDVTLDSFFAPSPPAGVRRLQVAYAGNWYTHYYEFELVCYEKWRISLGVDYRNDVVNELGVDVRNFDSGRYSDIWKLKPWNNSFFKGERGIPSVPPREIEY